jgi:LysM repeat protein
MDTISRENNSMLPVFGVVAGVIGLILGGIGIAQASKANKALETLQPKVDKIDAVEGQINNVAAAADRAAKEVASLKSATQAGFDQIGPIIGDLRASVTKLDEAMKKPPVAEKSSSKKGGEPVVAGPGEYVVKSGDTGMKIATANKVALADLLAVNPGVNWNKLGAGQKVKLPAKK